MASSHDHQQNKSMSTQLGQLILADRLYYGAGQHGQGLQGILRRVGGRGPTRGAGMILELKVITGPKEIRFWCEFCKCTVRCARRSERVPVVLVLVVVIITSTFSTWLEYTRDA